MHGGRKVKWEGGGGGWRRRSGVVTSPRPFFFFLFLATMQAMHEVRYNIP